jgi:hypothetical protein
MSWRDRSGRAGEWVMRIYPAGRRGTTKKRNEEFQHKGHEGKHEGHKGQSQELETQVSAGFWLTWLSFVVFVFSPS